MKHFLSSFPRVIISNFSGRNLFWNVIAVALTYLIVVNGIDWYYFIHTRNIELLSAFKLAIILGGTLPLLLPVTLILIGYASNNKVIMISGWALAQAALAGLLISSTYKAFTGRIQPNIEDMTTNISTDFNFGFWNHGIFWGWPSSHTTIAFAMAVALIGLFPHEKAMKYIAILYAFYIGIGVSLTIHWFSDFVAGAIIGTVLGLIVSQNFRGLLPKNV